MSVKCPACGFESPEEARWCDFCKEPFKKKAEGPAEAAAERAPSPPPVPAPQRPTLKYYQPVPGKPPPAAANQKAPKTPPPELSFELKDDEKVPHLPNWLRYAAWAFLGVWIISAMILAGLLYGRYRLSREAPAPPSYQPRIP